MFEKHSQGEVHGYFCDVTKPEDYQNLATKIYERFEDGVGLLHLNAGLSAHTRGFVRKNLQISYQLKIGKTRSKSMYMVCCMDCRHLFH